MKNLARVLALVLALMLVFSACSKSSGDSSASSSSSSSSSTKTEEKKEEKKANYVRITDPDTLSYAVNVEPAKLDPQANGYLAGMTIQKMVFDMLLTKDEEGNFYPCLAESWEYANPENTIIRFHLRKDVTWHNGDKFTADDCVFTMQRATEIANSKTMFTSVDAAACEAVDDYTFDLHLKYSCAPIMRYLATTRGQIVHRAYVESMTDEEFARKPMGTGAFVFDEWITGDRVNLHRNDNYWGPKPIFSKATVRFIIESATRAIELESGGVDAIGDVAADDISRMQGEEGVQVLMGPSVRLHGMVMWEEHPILSNIHVRRALAHAIDMEAVVAAAYKQAGTVADSTLPPTVYGYESQGVYKYDPEYAKAELAEAGYNQTDKRLQLVYTTQEESLSTNSMEICQAYWAEVGIDVEIRVYDQATSGEITRNHESYFSNFVMSPGSNDGAHMWLSMWEGQTGNMVTSDKEINEWLQKGQEDVSENRAEWYKKIQRKIHEEYKIIPISFGVIVYAARDYVDNFDVNSGNIPDLKLITWKS